MKFIKNFADYQKNQTFVSFQLFMERREFGFALFKGQIVSDKGFSPNDELKPYLGTWALLRCLERQNFKRKKSRRACRKIEEKESFRLGRLVGGGAKKISCILYDVLEIQFFVDYHYYPLSRFAFSIGRL
jgi:hypothetical protein